MSRTKRSTVENRCKLTVEPATMEQCPRCKGFGACFPADFKPGGTERCELCHGHGELWQSECSGYTRPIGGRTSVLY